MKKRKMNPGEISTTAFRTPEIQRGFALKNANIGKNFQAFSASIDRISIIRRLPLFPLIRFCNCKGSIIKKVSNWFLCIRRVIGITLAISTLKGRSPSIFFILNSFISSQNPITISQWKYKFYNKTTDLFKFFCEGWHILPYLKPLIFKNIKVNNIRFFKYSLQFLAVYGLPPIRDDKPV